MNTYNPRPLYQTDQDAKKIQTLLDHRTKQLVRANKRMALVGFLVMILLAILIGIAT